MSNSNIDFITKYLNANVTLCGNSGIGAYDNLILKHGKSFIGRKLAADYPVCQEFVKEHHPKTKECFYNSQVFVALTSGGDYYEGYMCDALLPVMHAWIVMADGNVVDMTLEARDRYLKRRKLYKPQESPVGYLGVLVPKKFIIKTIRRLNLATPMAHMYYLKETRPFLL